MSRPSSRKASAMVRPVSATRSRLPGGSFIWPNTIALACALAYTREHRQAGVLLCDVVDELQHVHGLAHTGAAEQADLAALGEGHEQVDDLDARDQQVLAARLLIERRR